MKDVMGVIYTGENDARLRELTMTRAIAALPVAGRYRVIDFLVSAMVNARMRNVGVIMQKNYHSLMDHLGSGKEWDLHGKNDGLYLLPPFLTRENVGVYNGVLDALRSNTNYLTRSRQEYVVFSGSNFIYNARFSDFIRYHLDSGAEITLMYTKDPSVRREEAGTYLNVAEDGRVTDVEKDPTEPANEATFMEVLIMRRDLMRQIVDKAVAHGYHDLIRDLLIPMALTGQARINVYFVNRDLSDFRHSYSFDELITEMPAISGKMDAKSLRALAVTLIRRLPEWMSDGAPVIIRSSAGAMLKQLIAQTPYLKKEAFWQLPGNREESVIVARYRRL